MVIRYYYAELNDAGIVKSKLDTNSEINAPNMIALSSLDDAELGEYWNGSAFEASSPPSLVPRSVSAFQGMMALHQEGLLMAVQAYMDSPAATVETKLAWQKAGDWERNSPTVLAMLQLLGLTPAQGDQLFITAKGIKA